jgi:hypothetical protein
MRQAFAVFRSPSPAFRDCVYSSDNHLFRVFVPPDTTRSTLSRYVPDLVFSVRSDNLSTAVTGPPEIRILLILRGVFGFLGAW